MSLVGFKAFCWGKNFGTVEDTRLGSINKESLKRGNWPIVRDPELQPSR